MGKVKFGSLVRKMKIELNPALLEQIKDFCERWHIIEFAVFGSALRDNFRQGSDVDVLATFSPDADWSLLDHVQMTSELESIFDRNVDLITKRALKRSKNWIRRNEILKTAEVIYNQDQIAHAP